VRPPENESNVAPFVKYGDVTPAIP
jgi:hypothetical protein